jgi:predicted nucleic acid-binding protein
MIVLDASATIEWLLQTPIGQLIEKRIYSHNETLHAPELLDLEVAQVLRRLVIRRSITEDRAGEAVRDFQDIRIRRYGHLLMMRRIWELRHNISSYDAAYVVLAETLGATLVTRDRKLGSAPGHSAQVEVH